MNITILTIGTQGDVQPFVALGVGLKDAGHEVTLATGKGFETFVSEHGLRYASLDVALLEFMQSPEGKGALAGKNLLGTMKKVMSMFRKVLDEEWAAAQGADTIVYHPKALGGYHIAEALGVPAFLSHPVPMFSPTRAFPNPVLPFADLGGFLNKLSYGAFLRLVIAPYHRVINRWRKETLRLLSHSFMAGELKLRDRPVPRLYCYSPHVVPTPVDWGGSSTATGYWFLDKIEWQPPGDLAAFLASESPPVYVGFGSLAGWNPRNVLATAIKALKESGQRGVLATGRDGLLPSNVPHDVYVLESAPHDWLFPRMVAVMHHGGAGTTGEGLRAGKPTVICPSSINDQAFWGRRVFNLGAGPEPIPIKKLTVDRLSRAIRTATTDDGVRSRAADLGEKIRAEHGVARAVEIIDDGIA